MCDNYLKIYLLCYISYVVLEVHGNYNEWVRNKVSLNMVGVIFNVIDQTIIIKD